MGSEQEARKTINRLLAARRWAVDGFKVACSSGVNVEVKSPLATLPQSETGDPGLV